MLADVQGPRWVVPWVGVRLDPMIRPALGSHLTAAAHDVYSGKKLGIFPSGSG